MHFNPLSELLPYSSLASSANDTIRSAYLTASRVTAGNPFWEPSVALPIYYSRSSHYFIQSLFAAMWSPLTTSCSPGLRPQGHSSLLVTQFLVDREYSGVRQIDWYDSFPRSVSFLII